MSNPWTQPTSRHVPIGLGNFLIWSAISHFQHSWALSWLLSRIWAFFRFLGYIASTVLQFSTCLMQYFVFETFSVSRVIIITNLNNFTLSPDCCHKNAQLTQLSALLTVGIVDFEKKKKTTIGVSLLVWSPFRKSRVKALIKRRILMNIC